MPKNPFIINGHQQARQRAKATIACSDDGQTGMTGI